MEIETFAQIHRLRTRVDVDSTKIIPGKDGHIFEVADHLLGILLIPDRHRVWANGRRKMVRWGFTIFLDCDGEGIAHFDPFNPEQARVAIALVRTRRVGKPRGLPLTPKRARELVGVRLGQRNETPSGPAETAIPPPPVPTGGEAILGVL